MTTIDELLKNYREVFCLNEVEKGECFERLMKNFLLTYAPYRGKFKNVWLWKNFPYKNQLGGRDLGIDIVAETFDKNFIAVQCKFYSDNSTVKLIKKLLKLTPQKLLQQIKILCTTVI